MLIKCLVHTNGPLDHFLDVISSLRLFLYSHMVHFFFFFDVILYYYNHLTGRGQIRPVNKCTIHCQLIDTITDPVDRGSAKKIKKKHWPGRGQIRPVVNYSWSHNPDGCVKDERRT